MTLAMPKGFGVEPKFPGQATKAAASPASRPKRGQPDGSPLGLALGRFCDNQRR
jgi:hypothetical protein